MKQLKTFLRWLGFTAQYQLTGVGERLQQFTGWLLVGLKLTSKDLGSVSKSSLVLCSIAKEQFFALVDALVRQDVR